VIDVPLWTMAIRVQDACTVSINGEPRSVEPGESVDLGSPGEAVTYVAVPGGFDVPEVLGSRGTLLVAQLGGYHGRMLRKGDLLLARLSQPPSEPKAVDPGPPDPAAPIRVMLGPD